MRPLNEIRHYMGNYHVKSAVYHYHRYEFKQSLGFLRKALSEESILSAGERRNAQRYLALSLKGVAEKLAAGGELDEGLEHLRQAAEANPTYPDIHFRMARILERLERADDAIEAYGNAIECHPAYTDAHVALGYCLLAQGRHAEAATAFENAMALRLEQIKGPFRKGLDLLKADRIEECLEHLHEVFLAVPRLADECLRRALELLRAEEYENALAEFDRAVELNPKYPDLHNYRGVVLCELDRPDEAVEAFRRSVELSPDQTVPRLNLAFARLRAGQPHEAEAELEAILDREPNEPVAAAKLEELRAERQADKRGRPGAVG